MRLELRELQDRINITTLYVTHDQVEALSMSNRIAVMRDGRLVQVDPPREIYMRPTGSFIATFMGSTNLIPGTLTRDAESNWAVETAIGTFQSTKTSEVGAGQPVLLTIQPVNVRVHPETNHTVNVVKGTVVLTVFCGDFVDCQFSVDNQAIYGRYHPSLELSKGQQVYIELPAEHCIALAPDS